jgi:uncharacterized protein (DUF169 family)
MDLTEASAALTRLLDLRAAPVAIAFCDEPPAGVKRVAEPRPAGCAYWRMAGAGGEVFYTEAADHHGCPVGAHTHAAPMPDEVRAGLQELIGTMVKLDYLAAGEVPAIPTRAQPLRIAVYAPLAASPVAPTVVLVRATGRQLMLLQEAAQAIGVVGTGPTLGRPTCAILPQAERSARTATSFGCVGNRTYTGLGDDEGWFAVPGAALAALCARLEIVVRANAALADFHRARA